jgi:hypothetical protein
MLERWEKKKGRVLEESGWQGSSNVGIESPLSMKNNLKIIPKTRENDRVPAISR